MGESKNIRDALSGVKIKNRNDLEVLTKFLEEQGFGYIGYWDMHKKKLQNIASKANTFGVDKKIDLSGDDYEEEERKAKEFYSKFSSDDKIKEFISMFHISSDDEGKSPSLHNDNKELIEWYEFKTKFGLKDIYKSWDRITFYNLDKKFIKIRFGSREYDFKRFYKLVFNEECKNFDAPTEWNDKGSGLWQDLGRIEIKIYKNFYCDIRGEGLSKLKEIYFKDLNDQNSNIIMYNGKMIFTKPNKET